MDLLGLEQGAFRTEPCVLCGAVPSVLRFALATKPDVETAGPTFAYFCAQHTVAGLAGASRRAAKLGTA